MDKATNRSLLLHKILGTTPNVGLQPKEVLSYSFAGLGQNIICGIVTSYIVYYYINGLLLNEIAVGVIVLCVRLFDAFNDPIMGSIVDKTKTKTGKCRPYLKWMSMPIAVFTVLLFLPLTPEATGTYIIVTIIYTIWSVLYTIVDVPYWGLSTSMTNDTHQRGIVLSVARIFCSIGAGIVTILLPTILDIWKKPFADDKGKYLSDIDKIGFANVFVKNFWWLILILVVIAIPAFYIGYKNTNERYYNEKDVRSLKENLKLLFKNKPLLLVVASGILGAGKTMMMYSGIFFAEYNLPAIGFTLFGLDGVQLTTFITLTIVPGGLAASLLVPYLTKKFGKKNAYIYSHLFGGIVLLICHFIGWNEGWKIIVFFISLILVGIPLGLWNILSYAMIADSVDYLEWKTKQRAEGICFSMQTFISKIGMAVGAAISAFGLFFVGIDRHDPSSWSIEGNEKGLNVLFNITILVSGISMLLSIIPFLFYKFNEKEQIQAIKETTERRDVENANLTA